MGFYKNHYFCTFGYSLHPMEDLEVTDDCPTHEDKGKCSMTERVMLVVFIVGFCMSEGLPFIEEFCGIKINGHGIFHIVHGLLTSDCHEVVEGLEVVIEEADDPGDSNGLDMKTVSD